MWPFSSGKRDSRSEISSIQENVRGSFILVKEDFKKVAGWISSFNKKTLEQDERIAILETKLNEVMEFVGKDSRKLERVQSFNRSNQSFMNDQSGFDRGILEKRLTPIQKKVVALMISSEIPLEYVQIAKKLGLNIVTIRRHMNDIKRTGFEIKEKINAQKKRKVFYIDGKMKKLVLKGKIKFRNQ